MLLSLSFVLAAPVITVEPVPSAGNYPDPVTPENLGPLREMLASCVTKANASGKTAWYGTLTGGFLPSVNVIEYAEVVPKPDFDAFAALWSCVEAGRPNYPFPGKGAFRLQVEPEAPVEVHGRRGSDEAHTHARYATLGCLDATPAARGAFLLSRHGELSRKKTVAHPIGRKNAELTALANCVANRMAGRVDDPVEAEGVLVTVGSPAGAGGTATETRVAGKKWTPKFLVIRPAPYPESYIIMEAHAGKVDCAKAAKSKEWFLSAQVPADAKNATIGRDPYVQAWWGDAAGAHEPVFAVSGKLTESGDPGTGTSGATMEVMGPDPGQFALPSTELAGIWCYD